MSRAAFTRSLLIMAIAPCLLATEASAGVIPWTYNTVFGYGSPWTGGYGYASYGYPTYGGGYAPDYLSGRTYTAGYAPYYAAAYPQAGCGCSPCQSSCGPCNAGCSPCSGGCSTGNCGTSNYAPSATDNPTPAAGGSDSTGGDTKTFRKKELPADEFKPAVPGSDFRSTPPTERDSTVVPRQDEWNGTRGTTDAPPAGLSTPATPAEPANEVVPGGLIRPAPAEPRNDFFNETNEVIPGATETRPLPAPPVAATTTFMPPRQRLQLHTGYALPVVSRISVPTEKATATASIARN